ncbi:MAG: RNA methyltransferase [Polyangiaceae bacterium]
MRRLAIALVHHPVLDGKGATVTTAVTNLDVHDLARSARSYGVADYFIAHPIAAQRELVTRIRDHWMDGSSGRRIPDRREALTVLRVVHSLEAAIDALGGRSRVEVWVTAARRLAPSVLTFQQARARLECDVEGGGEEDKTLLVVFGTGWGLAPEVIESADALLEPIRSQSEAYNHLSVRSACAIALDRLLGAR